jgi:DNA polymerase-3 subunit alpha
MLLSREIADFTRGESDALRKAMGKKLIDKLNQMYPKFLKGGTAKGYDPKILEKIWEDWRAFASYAFNKSHATCYSWVAYQTAYLKANYPSQYMAGVMSRNFADKKTITKFMDECKALKIKALGPDINESRLKFSVNRKGDIRFGLGAIAGVGESAVNAIIDEREKNGIFTSIYNFVERINLSACNKKCIENLAVSGAFDSISGMEREQIYAINDRGEFFLDTLVRYGINFQQDKATSVNTLFGDSTTIEIAKPEIPKIENPWSTLQKLNKERELIGIYISGHPLDEYRVVLEKLCNTRLEELEDIYSINRTEITFGGIVIDVVERTNKYGVPYGFVKIEDMTFSKEIFISGKEWADWKGYFTKDSAIFVSARFEPHRYNKEEKELHITKVEFLVEVKEKKIEKITLSLDINLLNENLAEEIIAKIQGNPGEIPLYFNIVDKEEGQNVIMQSQSHKIAPNYKLFEFFDENPSINYFIN